MVMLYHRGMTEAIATGAHGGNDPIEMLQTLGMDEAEARDLASVVVVCPIPGADRNSSLGEFMTSEHGKAKATTILETAKNAKEKGASNEEAIGQALGFTALLDKHTGKLVRVVPVEEEKKKNLTPK